MPSGTINQRLTSTKLATNALCGFDGPQGRINLIKHHVNLFFNAVWLAKGKPKLSGHSFCVGGASLDIQFLGRWTLECYKRYFKRILPANLSSSLSILGVPPL